MKFILRILFILKRRDVYFQNEETGAKKGLSSGLTNSARFVSNMLEESAVFSKMVQVDDNNDIDREVSLYRPDIVIIEAYWVVPDKFEVLVKLHPHIKWIIRNHSKIPFCAVDGVIVDWSIKYAAYKNVFISSNSIETTEDMRIMIKSAYSTYSQEFVEYITPYLPNYYPISNNGHKFKHVKDGIIDVGCFGAIRPLKNNLIQCLAAIKYANDRNLHLRLHMNSTRIETNGEAVIKNINSLFENIPHELIKHDWLEHSKFVELVKEMDIVQAVSYSESFCIVAADAVANGIPVVVSDEIYWVDNLFHADPNSVIDIEKTMAKALFFKPLSSLFDSNKIGLNKYNTNSKKQWLNVLRDLMKGLDA